MSQTQPELAKYINVSYQLLLLLLHLFSFVPSCPQDVFGASDDEDDDVIVPSRRPSVTPGDAATFGGVSGDGEPNLFESDEEDEADQRVPPSKKLKLGSKESASTKSRTSAKNEQKRKSQSAATRPAPSAAPAEAPQWADSEEDEYASDREPDRTAEDDEFIDRDDDNADLVREYEEDKQDFNDRRPAGSKASSARARTVGPEDDSNPLSQTLVDMKRKRYDEWSDEKKSHIAHELLVQMDRAVVEDEELFRVGSAAIVKVRALPRVQALVGIKGLQPTLLDHDLLSALRKWIEPRDKNTLPALAVRTAVYDMLRRLPCQLDHLRRSGIGKTIMALLKHNQEIDANKQLLNEIVEKWNRLIFNKSSDARSRTQRMASASAPGAAASTSASASVKMSAAPAAQPSGGSGARSGAVSSSEQRGLDEILAGQNSRKIDDEFNRVRVPFSSGFMFSVRPESTVDKKSVLEAMREASGGTKDVISKRMKDMAGSSKKQAFRPVGVSVTGKAPK
jgi:transcription factor SPN1